MRGIGVAYSFLGHDRVEEVNYCVMVRHEASLVLQLVEEDILTVDPDVRVADLPINRDFSLYLVRWIVLCDSKIRFAELAVAAAPPHNLDKSMSRRTLNIRNILQFRPARNVDELGAVSRLDVGVNVSNHMVALTYDYVVDA